MKTQFTHLLPDNSPDRFKIMYLLLAAACLGIILIISAFVIHWNSSTDLRDTVTSNSERIADAIYYTEVDAILISSANDLYSISLAASARDALDGRIRDMYDPLNIVNVQIFNRDSSIIYGTAQLPDESNSTKLLTKTLLQGDLIYDLHKGQTVIDLVGEKRPGIDLAEVLLPIRHKNGQIMGAIAIYTDVTRLTRKYHRQMINSMIAQSVMLLLLSLISYLIIIRESKELKQVYITLEEMATTDPLTGISNRRQLLERAAQFFALAQRAEDTGQADKNGLGFIMFDIDHFKRVNDTYGHLAGDRILHDLAGEIRRTLRQYDIFGRYGGEEFLVVLPNTHNDETARIAERLLETVRNHNFIWEEKPITITVSAGVVWTATAQDTLDQVLSRVDHLLYEAKQQGRDMLIFR